MAVVGDYNYYGKQKQPHWKKWLWHQKQQLRKRTDMR